MAPLQAAELGYELISPAQPTSDADKVEVVEFFWYGCPHCYDFEPYMEDWAKTKPDNVSYRLEAPPLNSSWTVHSRAFYAAETLSVLDKLHRPLFDAIHKDKRQLRTEAAILEFVAEVGLDKEAFAKAMNSFAVDTKIRRASQLARAHQIRGTPTVTINGKYKTSGSLAGGNPAVIDVIRELVREESSN
jgi:thiol:disulfide interchange protein DsbA